MQGQKSKPNLRNYLRSAYKMKRSKSIGSSSFISSQKNYSRITQNHSQNYMNTLPGDMVSTLRNSSYKNLSINLENWKNKTQKKISRKASLSKDKNKLSIYSDSSAQISISEIFRRKKSANSKFFSEGMSNKMKLLGIGATNSSLRLDKKDVSYKTHSTERKIFKYFDGTLSSSRNKFYIKKSDAVVMAKRPRSKKSKSKEKNFVHFMKSRKKMKHYKGFLSYPRRRRMLDVSKSRISLTNYITKFQRFWILKISLRNRRKNYDVNSLIFRNLNLIEFFFKDKKKYQYRRNFEERDTANNPMRLFHLSKLPTPQDVLTRQGMEIEELPRNEVVLVPQKLAFERLTIEGVDKSRSRSNLGREVPDSASKKNEELTLILGVNKSIPDLSRIGCQDGVSLRGLEPNNPDEPVYMMKMKMKNFQKNFRKLKFKGNVQKCEKSKIEGKLSRQNLRQYRQNQKIIGYNPLQIKLTQTLTIQGTKQLKFRKIDQRKKIEKILKEELLLSKTPKRTRKKLIRANRRINPEEDTVKISTFSTLKSDIERKREVIGSQLLDIFDKIELLKKNGDENFQREFSYIDMLKRKI